MTASSRQRLRAELALAGVTIIWGTTFVVVKSALEQVSTVLFLTLRFILAAAVLWVIYRKSLRLRVAGPGLLAGTLLFIAYVFQTAGLNLTTPSKSAFLTGLAIPAVPLLNSLVYKVKPRLLDVGGIGLATLGMILMTVPAGGFSSGQSGFGLNRGDVLSFFCALTFALHIVVIGHFSKLHGFETISVIQIAVAALLGLSTFWFVEPVRLTISTAVAAAVLVTGLLATALAFTVMAWAQQYTSSARAALIYALEPPVAWLTSWAVTGERLTSRGFLGAAMILAGILLVELTRGRIETVPLVGTSE